MSKIERIDGKYEVKELLGGGGFSDVYLVDGPDGECALKLLKSEIANLKKAALEEFKNEFSILKDMRHPYIASILDFGYDDSSGRYYYTSEIIRGKDIVSATKGMKLEDVTDLFVQALRALGYLHSFRIFHFDVKAANVLVISDGAPSIKIIDFGLAGIDPRGKLIGTPSYMAPEIIAREHADGRADLYSLGVLWYMCLTRKNPFRAQNSPETLSRHQKLIPPAPSKVVPTLPKWLDSVVMRLLEKNPANRFPNAASVIREINRLSGQSFPLETRETLLSYLPDEGRFVGRAEQMAAIEGDLEALKDKTGKSGGCLVTGGIGVGKTRLLREVKYRAQLADVRIEWAQASEEEEFRSWCDKLSLHLSEGKGLCAFVLDDAQAAMENEVARSALISLISRARRPAETATAWIAISTRSITQSDARAALEAMLPLFIEIKPFDKEELALYVSSLTGLENPPPALVEGLFEKTEGNPLFLTEVLRSLIEGGGLFDEHGRWNEAIFEDVGVDFSKAAIPKTMSGMVVNRISQLAPEARALLEVLSAAGRPATAVELGRWGKVENPGPVIMQLLSLGLLDRVEGFALRFHNSLTCQVVYDAMTYGRRTQVHDAIAADIKASGGAENEAAWHASRGSDTTVAFEAALSLGERALTAGRGEEAAGHISRALDLVDPSDTEKRVEIQMKLGEAYLIGHDYPAATEHFSSAEAMITTNAGSVAMARWRSEVLVRLSGTYIKLGQFERARASLHDAKAAITEAGTDIRLDLTIQNFLGSIQFLEGNLEGAKQTFTATHFAAGMLPEEESRRITNNDLGMVLTALGEFTEAKDVLSRDLARANEIGDDLLIGRSLYNLAQLAQSMQDFQAAIESYKGCIEVCRRSHNIELLLRAYNGLGNVYHMSEDSEQSITFYERGMALHERTGDLRGGAAIAINMGLVESSRHRPDAALDHLVPAVEYLRVLPEKTAADWAALSRGLLEMGDIARQTGRLDEARMQLEEARGIAGQVAQAAPQRFWILATLAEVALAQGRKGEFSDLVAMLESQASTESEKKTLAGIRAKAGSVKRVQSQSQAEVQPQTPIPHTPYEKILQINKLIAAEHDLDFVLKTVLFYALELTAAEAGCVLMSDEGNGLSVAASRNLSGDEGEVMLSGTLAKKAIDEGRPIRTDDAMTDERFAKEASILAHSLKSVLCLPIRARGSVVGALYLEDRHRSAAFAAADFKLLDAFTDQVGLAIETARLLKKSEEKERSLSNELAEASKRAARFQEMLGGKPGAFRFDYGMLASGSSAMQKILRILDKVADTELAVFICGESGTGKELIARAMHSNHSRRKDGRFVAINCGAIPATLIESELFGYKSGAFTGASRDKPGLIEEASGGTLFLDEVGELAPDLQVKLLRVLQEKECTRIGETRPRKVDIRVITASNRDIEGLTKAGAFREDLFYRICQMKIEVPPLRQRPEDLAFLAEHFVSEASPGKKLKISPQLMRRFVEYPWPGNVRELENLIKVSVALVEGDVIDERAVPQNHPIARQWSQPAAVADVQLAASPAAATHAVRAAEEEMIDSQNEYDPAKSWSDYERAIIAKCLAANAFKVRQAAFELDLAPATLYSRMKEYGLKNTNSAEYAGPFIYTRGMKLADYLGPIFMAAFKAAHGSAKDAIANLRVSQGYFYKVMKKTRSS